MEKYNEQENEKHHRSYLARKRHLQEIGKLVTRGHLAGSCRGHESKRHAAKLVAVPLAGNVLLGEKLQVGEPLAVVGPTEHASVTLFVPVPS